MLPAFRVAWDPSRQKTLVEECGMSASFQVFSCIFPYCICSHVRISKEIWRLNMKVIKLIKYYVATGIPSYN